ncbi:toll/interleukin-1 receptor domain-containing protein, partial [Candidatus Propionivibrio aalborgensis]|uniref:toll/interleukin-1 receptor domain-containing protein n=1 Tax=Candidatus Propionivibrio aalborgensis TaxID=1860101 RepID=UPI001644AD34
MTGEDNSPRNAPATPRHGLFISYRRDDARGASGRLYDWLRIAFGREKVFRDVASIGPGKWRQRIDQALADSIVCLPVIGPRWCDSHNGPRLAQDGDMVRHELLTALADQDLTLIPTLVEGAAVPPQNKLPAELHALLEWNAFPLSEQGWDDDIRRLLAAVTECSGQPVAGDVDTLLIRVREAEARMRQLEQEKHLQADQLHALTETITALTRQMAENPASQRADLARALADLARGDTKAAEAEFEKVLDEYSAAAEDAAHEAAEAARHIANLALLDDIDKAVRYYRRACQLEPGHSESWRLLGLACLTAGDTGAARETLSRAIQLARDAGDTWGEAASLDGLGDVATQIGSLAEAKDHYTDAMKIVTARSECEPGNVLWQRGLSISHEKIGNVFLTQGNAPEALAAFRKCLLIREALASRDPANTGWQREISVTYDRIGEVLMAQGDLPEALAVFGKSLAIREALATRDTANKLWQRDLSVSHDWIGDVLVAKGDGPGALAALRKSLAIREALAFRDSANAKWQSDLSISHIKICEVLLITQDKRGALTACHKGLAIAERLADRDPDNADWQRCLSISHNKLGEVLVAQGDFLRALV